MKIILEYENHSGIWKSYQNIYIISEYENHIWIWKSYFQNLYNWLRFRLFYLLFVSFCDPFRRAVLLLFFSSIWKSYLSMKVIFEYENHIWIWKSYLSMKIISEYENHIWIWKSYFERVYKKLTFSFSFIF